MKDPFRSIQLYLQQGTRKIFQRSNLRLAAFHQKWLLNVNRYECSLHVSFIAVKRRTRRGGGEGGGGGGGGGRPRVKKTRDRIYRREPCRVK